MNDNTTRRAFRNARAEWRFCYYPPGARMGLHRHDCAQFSVILAGRQREITGRGDVDCSPLTMEVKPRHFQHANEYGDDGALLLSLNLFATDDEDREPALADWRVRPAESAGAEWRLLARELAAPCGPDEARVNDLTDDLLAAVLIDADDRVVGAAPAWLTRACEALRETDMDAAAIARDAGVHRVHLARSFRKHFATSPTEYRRRARLARAATAIAQDRCGLADAASAAGFADQAHMTRDMRREIGLTPGALARLFGAR